MKRWLNIFSVAFVIVILLYIFFNYKYARDHAFEFNEVSVYGFYEEEYLDKYKMPTRWMKSYEAMKRVKVDGTYVIIPIFCLKPDLSSKPINYRIYFDEKLVKESLIDNDDVIIYLKGDVSKLGYEIGSFLEIKFEIDTLWTLKDYGINDDRDIGIGVGNIRFG